MTESMWGILGSEQVSRVRRTRTLGLGASVRLFNELAVPGLGGVWYGKQLLLACLGIAIVEHVVKSEQVGRRAGLGNIRAANAVEAIACWHALESNEWKGDARLRGREKLAGKSGDLGFATVAHPSFYVTQPMRMATVLALPALGLVNGGSRRFNAFSLTEAGRAFVETALQGARPFNRSVVGHLSHWAAEKPGTDGKPEDRVHTHELGRVLSLLEPLPADAVAILRERLLQGGDESPEETGRRVGALAWMQELHTQRPGRADWDTRPDHLSGAHWHDLEAGARLFAARDAALAVLDALERHMARQADMSHVSLARKGTVPDSLARQLKALRRAARTYLDMEHRDTEARRFCDECRQADPAAVLRALVGRDGSVLRLSGNDVKPGPAFRQGSASDEYDSSTVGQAESGVPDVEAIPLPANISYRMHNLYLLSLDMQGELDAHLSAMDVGADRMQAMEAAL